MITQENNDWQQENIKNTVQVAIWTVVWLISTALVAFGPKFIWDFETSISVIALILHIAAGIKMVLVTRRQILSLDELMQKIQLNAMALSLGVGLIAGTSYEMLEDIRLITYEPEISHLIMVMAVAYMVGIIMGKRKYL
ncbi:hypothetical protein [Thalassotalea crassostreae]|uniref:hypothetical protein n=1 Tax=Thalassotalea crassostreae TaxID=1763536 RepID=UPI000837C635|nr:hypothetical protein [Thalassotalea crassostreae]